MGAKPKKTLADKTEPSSGNGQGGMVPSLRLKALKS